MLHNTNLKNA